MRLIRVTGDDCDITDVVDRMDAESAGELKPRREPAVAAA